MSKENSLSKKDIVDTATLVKSMLAPFCKKIEVVGSIRRNKESPNDVDIVLIPNEKDPISTTMASVGVRENGGEKKESWIINGVKVELYYATEESWGAFILTYTGSKMYNISMRALAKRKGLMLNQYGLFKDGLLVASKTEEDIFKALEMDYKEPEKRD